MTRDLSIPLGAYREIVIRFPEQQLTETDWQILLDVLTAMRPALVEPDIADAEIAGPLELTPDEAIEVALVLREALTIGINPVRRGTDLADLADRLDWFERDTGEADAQDDGDLAWADLHNGAPRPGWQASRDDWHEHIARLRNLKAGRG